MKTKVTKEERERIWQEVRERRRRVSERPVPTSREWRVDERGGSHFTTTPWGQETQSMMSEVFLWDLVQDLEACLSPEGAALYLGSEPYLAEGLAEDQQEKDGSILAFCAWVLEAAHRSAVERERIRLERADEAMDDPASETTEGSET